LDFSVIFYKFCKAAKHTHEIIDTQEGETTLSFAFGSLGKQELSHNDPCQPPTATGRRLRHVPTGGEVAGGEGSVRHDQQNKGNKLGAKGVDGQS
jgi:hypothetical protein